jgi:hypothetical protein
LEKPSQIAIDYTDHAIQVAVDNADHVNPEWSEWAYKLLIWFAQKTEGPFMVEDVREATKDTLPIPPSQRAWGAVVRRASKEGHIKMVGYSRVKNKNAHCTPASMWIKISKSC